jgi:hypothetical protein
MGNCFDDEAPESIDKYTREKPLRANQKRPLRTAAATWARKWGPDPVGAAIRAGLGLREAALKGQQDEVGAAADTKLVEQVRDVELDGALGDIEFAGDFLVGKILKQ